MTEKSFPERMYEAGFTDLVSVIPPGAQIAPTSTIAQASVGKIPGVRYASGLWGGYAWRSADASIDEVRSWVFNGANIGLRATNFPGVDIDVSDPQLAQMIEGIVLAKLGHAPVRTGRAPKRLIMYRTTEPFSKMKLIITKPDQSKHLVELLGHGQQYLVHGTHPSGRAYSWNIDPTTVDVPFITREQAIELLDQIAEWVGEFGTVTREGDGRRGARTVANDQTGLLAPSIDSLREVVALLPNNDDVFPTRDDYVRIGYAIRASVPAELDEDGFEIFASWAARHETDGRVAGNPETWRSDWRRFNPPFSVGWLYLAQLAAPYGYNLAADAFEATGEAPELPTPGEEAAPEYSDQWLAEQIVARHRGVLRYIPAQGKWLVWDGCRWKFDAVDLAQHLIQQALKTIALPLLRVGGSAAEVKAAKDLAKSITSARRTKDVMATLRVNTAIALAIEALDHDIWKLNTPAGVVDLTTGAVSPPDPDALMTKSTLVPPDFDGAAPDWTRFLAEATGGDRELESYLQRLAGYCLTGSVKEEHFSVLFGPGGRGKGTFVNTLAAVMGDYAIDAHMDVFMETKTSSHPTELADLMGARLVAASEAKNGQRWDDQRVKALTGGDRVKARFMRQDFFTYVPTFKLVFSVNSQPELRDVDDAMRRRIQMVPFARKPAKKDKDLKDRLRKNEAPQILAWMIEGCLAWQRDGLAPPAAVVTATEEYFEQEDAWGRWLDELTEPSEDPTAFVSSAELFASWQEWANSRNEYVGTMKRMVNALKARGLLQWRDPATRHRGFRGISIKAREGNESLFT